MGVQDGNMRDLVKKVGYDIDIIFLLAKLELIKS